MLRTLTARCVASIFGRTPTNAGRGAGVCGGDSSTADGSGVLVEAAVTGTALLEVDDAGVRDPGPTQVQRFQR